MADRIAVMNNGKVEQYATPQEIYNRPTTPFVAEFVRQSNWLPFQRSTSSSLRACRARCSASMLITVPIDRVTLIAVPAGLVSVAV